jgi:hypothetical protein
MLNAALIPHGRAASARALLRRGGYVETVVAPSTGRLILSWTVAPAVRHGSASGAALLASATTILDQPGANKIELRLTTAGRAALSSQPHLTVIARGAFTPTGQHATRLTRTFTLGR